VLVYPRNLSTRNKTPLEIPVKLEGLAEGVKAGGKLALEMRKLRVKGLYTNIPERIVIDVTSLGLGKSIQVGNVSVDNLEILNAKNAVVAQVKLTRQELVLNQVSDMKKHIGEVEKLYQDIRSLRHDMGNHIQMLEHLVAENHMDDAAEYMEHLKKEWKEISPEIKTGSPVIDVILMEKLREAKEKQIRFISDFHYPGDTKLNAFDLSVILNNALDNCMENVSGENPYISISSFRKNSIFMITIKNRYEGELNYKDSDLPETTKSGKEHGIGLHNIRRVARMYMGDISLEQENQEVVLSIMLQVE
jgi:sensor histidine kinase regulating citrate/malate metabolism